MTFSNYTYIDFYKNEYRYSQFIKKIQLLYGQALHVYNCIRNKKTHIIYVLQNPLEDTPVGSHMH